MKRGRSGSFHKSVEEISNFQAIIKTLRDQINYDFYLTRKTTKHFIALLTILETDGIQIIKKIYKVDDNRKAGNMRNKNQKIPDIPNLTSSFFRTWNEFRKTQIRLCSVPFIRLAISYLKEHLKACNKIVINLINERNQDIESASILKYKGKLNKSQAYDSTFISQFKKISDAIIKHLQDLKEDVNTLHDRAVSEEDGQVDYHVTDEQSYQFAQFYSDLNSTYSIIFKPFQQYDKDEMKSIHLNCLHHIEKCENCLHPKTKKGFPKYNPWELDHLYRWKDLISDSNAKFERLFKTLQSQTSFEILKKYLLSLENDNDENQNEENVVIDAAEAINDNNENDDPKPKRRHHHHHKKTDENDENNDNVATENENDGKEDTILIIEEEEEENSIEASDDDDTPNEPIIPKPILTYEYNNIFNIISDYYPNLNEKKENDNDDDEEKENLRRSINNLTIKLKQYKNLLKKEQKKNEDLEARIRAYEDDEIALIQQREINNQLLDENMRLKAKIKELENDIYRLKSIMLVNNKNDYMNQRNTNIFVVDDGLKSEFTRISDENVEKTVEIDNLRSAISKLQMIINISSNVSKIKGENSSEIEERYVLLLQQYKDIEEENIKINQISEKNKQFKQDYLQCEQRIKELNEILARKDLDLVSLKQTIEKLQKMNSDLKMNQQRSGNVYLNMINPNSDDFMTREQALEKIRIMTKEKVQNEDEIRKLKQEIISQEKEKEVLNRTINTLQSSESSLKEELNNKDNKIQSLNEKLTENSKQLLEINSTKRKLKNVQDENEELNGRIDEMKNKINGLNEKVKSIEELKAQLNNVNEKVIKKKQKIAKLKDQISRKDAEINRLKEIRNNDDDIV